jgi:hypothetical protein
MRRKIRLYKEGKITFGKIFDIYSGWKAYSIWADSYKIRKEIKNERSLKSADFSLRFFPPRIFSAVTKPQTSPAL